jgi:hypothetical protein
MRAVLFMMLVGCALTYVKHCRSEAMQARATRYVVLATPP